MSSAGRAASARLAAVRGESSRSRCRGASARSLGDEAFALGRSRKSLVQRDELARTSAPLSPFIQEDLRKTCSILGARNFLRQEALPERVSRAPNQTLAFQPGKPLACIALGSGNRVFRLELVDELIQLAGIDHGPKRGRMRFDDETPPGGAGGFWADNPRLTAAFNAALNEVRLRWAYSFNRAARSGSSVTVVRILTS